jgi:tetratricopeptide (TPR) repeat protein
MRDIDWERLERALFERTVAELSAFAAAHPGERCYGFAYDCNADCGEVLPCLNTEVALQAAVAGAFGRSPWEGMTAAEIAERLRWNPGDWAHQPIGDPRAWAEAWEPFRSRLEESQLAEDGSATSERLLEAATRVVMRLEKEGAFEPLARTDAFATLVIDHDESAEDAWSRTRWLRLVFADRGTAASAADVELADARAREALAALEAEDQALAMRLAAEALARDGRCARALLVIGLLALRRGETRRAADAFKRALGGTLPLTTEERAETHASRGLALLDDARDSARADFEAALALDPSLPIALYGRGVVQLHERRVDESLRAFDACLAADPDWPMARLYRSFAHGMAGNAAEARADRKQAIAEDADLAEVAEGLDQLVGRKRGRR